LTPSPWADYDLCGPGGDFQKGDDPVHPPKEKTVGALREYLARSNGCGGRSVKDELRRNLIEKLRRGDIVFPGIIGYDETVIPQVCNAILSRHDLLLLGLRGQAKTRLIRMLTLLLDDWLPILAACEVPDDPLSPRLTRGKRIVVEQGDEAEITWLHREQRFHEKLATPDVTMADLIGDIDLVKHAEGRPLTDEGVIHYGLIPRTNRGIFAMNELPDLAPRIQVGLFNALEERDVQVRGFPLRIPLDLCMVFTANPEDYTTRGRIVTPLKDRIGSVVRTHYPLRTEDALAITQGSAWLARPDAPAAVDVPRYLLEVVEEFARIARSSPHVNQQSGVSVRASIASAELLVSNAERRCLVHEELRVVPRISDLQYLAAGCRGKIELMLAEDEQSEEKLIGSILGEAVKSVFERYAKSAELEAIVEAFREGKTTLETGDGVATSDLAAAVEKMPPLKNAAVKFCVCVEHPANEAAYLAAAAEFILEGLYVNNRLSKYAFQNRTFFKR
jgi:magnesium chelatase subunit I